MAKATRRVVVTEKRARGKEEVAGSGQRERKRHLGSSFAAVGVEEGSDRFHEDT